jgi:hypothetical protein
VPASRSAEGVVIRCFDADVETRGYSLAAVSLGQAGKTCHQWTSATIRQIP